MIALTAFLHWWLVSLRNSPKATLCLAIKMALTFLHGRFIYTSCTMIELGVMKASWHAKSIHYETMKFYIINLWWEKCPPYFTDRTVVFLHNGTLANHCSTQHSKSRSTLNLRQTKLRATFQVQMYLLVTSTPTFLWNLELLKFTIRQ